MASVKRKAPAQAKKLDLKFTIDCSNVVEDKVIIMRDFEKYLRERTKVNGKKGNLGTDVNLSSNATSIIVQSSVPFSKRYLKYLTKKYLKKVKIADYLRVVATDKTKYELKYLKIYGEEGEEE
ncbi:unnamed protein product [Blepharisma stoltei]|uniref:Large ribosomal subunit protein eL22 n=1 Tax=Blepharisma stoltei TaxID=1481888 RepID=A0AAU9KN93_9CILI|nr:unnamed protein product [Blepharisma stoltei]